MTLRVGVPTETKVDEFRVALTPEGVRELNMHGVEVLVQAGAGAGSSTSSPTSATTSRCSPSSTWPPIPGWPTPSWRPG